MRTTNVLTRKTNENLDRLSGVFTAKVNDGSHKLLSEILEVEKSREANRFDSSKQHLINYEAIEYDGRLCLKNKKTGGIYVLTKTAITNLFSKISYVSAKQKEELGNNFKNIIPAELHSQVLGRYNRIYWRNQISDVSDLNVTFYTLSKLLSTELIVKIVNYNLQNKPVGKETHQIKFQKVNNKAYIRAILDLKYKNFNVTEMLETLQEFFDKNVADWRVVFYHSDVFGDNFNLRISRKVQDKKDVTKVGEPLSYSLTINTSNTGKSSLNMSISVTILKCLNGMVGLGENDKIELIHNRNDKEVFKNALNDLLRQAEITWANIEEKYNLSRNIIIPDAEKLIKSVCKDYSLGQTVSSKILNEFKKELQTDGVSNLFKLTDAVTYVAHTHYSINQAGFHQLEQLGAELLFNYEKFLEKANINNVSNN